MIPLCIIIASYNTKEITKRSLVSLRKNFLKYPLDYEVIVVDNASTDGSVRMLLDLQKNWSNLKVSCLKKNIGFGKANNLGFSKCDAKYILCLNSDAIVTDIDFNDIINIFEIQTNLGVLTVKVILPDGKIDPASHRGFPTLWRSFCYFSGLEKLFKQFPVINKIFGGYHLVHLNLDTVHEIEAPTGAFLFTTKQVIDKIGGFDKDYFAYGEDIEMSYQIKKLGYKIIYYPLWSVLHLKSLSGLKKNDTKIKKKTSKYFYESMKIFYRKHYARTHNPVTNYLVFLAIDLKQFISK